MAKRTFTPEQIINKLREAEVLLSQGATTGEASRKIGITEQTYYRWRIGKYCVNILPSYEDLYLKQLGLNTYVKQPSFFGTNL